MFVETSVVVCLVIKGQSSFITETNKLVPPNIHTDVLWDLRYAQFNSLWGGRQTIFKEWEEAAQKLATDRTALYLPMVTFVIHSSHQLLTFLKFPYHLCSCLSLSSLF